MIYCVQKHVFFFTPAIYVVGLSPEPQIVARTPPVTEFRPRLLPSPKGTCQLLHRNNGNPPRAKTKGPAECLRWSCKKCLTSSKREAGGRRPPIFVFTLGLGCCSQPIVGSSRIAERRSQEGGQPKASHSVDWGLHLGPLLIQMPGHFAYLNDVYFSIVPYSILSLSLSLYSCWR